jgi:hypothetical protein
VFLMIDPYHKWLGISPDQQPPTHYQLLGIAPTETDPEVIEEAAIRQASHVRTYQTGPHAQECTRLLNEIAAARHTLLDPARRKTYDARLRRSPALASIASDGSTVDVELVESDAAAAPVLDPVGGAGLDEFVALVPRRRRRRRRHSWHAAVALLATLVVVGMLGLLLWHYRGDLIGAPAGTSGSTEPRLTAPREANPDRRTGHAAAPTRHVPRNRRLPGGPPPQTRP